MSDLGPEPLPRGLLGPQISELRLRFSRWLTNIDGCDICVRVYWRNGRLPVKPASRRPDGLPSAPSSNRKPFDALDPSLR